MTKQLLNATFFISVFIFSSFMMMSCQPKVKKNIGIQLYSVRDSMRTNPEKTIAEVGKIGYQYVELAGYRDGKIYDMEPAKFKALVEANNMYILSSHTGQNVPDSANWASTMEWWDKCIDAHITAGAKYIIQASMGRNAYDSLSILKRYCDYFNAVGEKCNAKGVQFGYHNHTKEFAQLEGNVIYDYMLQNTDPSKVFFQMDLYWVQEGGGNALEYIKKYPGRFLLYHVKDSAEVGQSGKMDFKPLYENSDLAGAKYFVVEVEKYTTGSQIESIKQSFEYLEKADYVK